MSPFELFCTLTGLIASGLQGYEFYKKREEAKASRPPVIMNAKPPSGGSGIQSRPATISEQFDAIEAKVRDQFLTESQSRAVEAVRLKLQNAGPTGNVGSPGNIGSPPTPILYGVSNTVFNTASAANPGGAYTMGNGGGSGYTKNVIVTIDEEPTEQADPLYVSPPPPAKPFGGLPTVKRRGDYVWDGKEWVLDAKPPAERVVHHIDVGSMDPATATRLMKGPPGEGYVWNGKEWVLAVTKNIF